MLKLDVRLDAIAKLVDSCDILADIGSDHAYLPLYLLKNGKINKAIITDINKGPLENSRKTADKHHLADKCSFYQGNGLYPIADKEFNIISICGMGGELISDIINDNIKTARKADYLILQPMNGKTALLKYLFKNSFYVEDEMMVKDKHLFYRIFKVGDSVKRNRTINEKYIIKNEFDYEFSPILINRKDTLMKEYLEFRLLIEKDIFKKITDANSDKNTAFIKERIDAIEKRLKLFI